MASNNPPRRALDGGIGSLGREELITLARAVCGQAAAFAGGHGNIHPEIYSSPPTARPGWASARSTLPASGRRTSSSTWPRSSSGTARATSVRSLLRGPHALRRRDAREAALLHAPGGGYDERAARRRAAQAHERRGRAHPDHRGREAGRGAPKGAGIRPAGPICGHRRALHGPRGLRGRGRRRRARHVREARARAQHYVERTMAGILASYNSDDTSVPEPAEPEPEAPEIPEAPDEAAGEAAPDPYAEFEAAIRREFELDAPEAPDESPAADAPAPEDAPHEGAPARGKPPPGKSISDTEPPATPSPPRTSKPPCAGRTARDVPRESNRAAFWFVIGGLRRRDARRAGAHFLLPHIYPSEPKDPATPSAPVQTAAPTPSSTLSSGSLADAHARPEVRHSGGRLQLDEAEQRAREMGGHLAVIDDAAELEAVSALAGGQGLDYLWIGFYRRDGAFYWVDNSAGVLRLGPRRALHPRQATHARELRPPDAHRFRAGSITTPATTSPPSTPPSTRRQYRLPDRIRRRPRRLTRLQL